MRKKLFKIGIAVAGLVVTTAVVAGATYAHNNVGGGKAFNQKNMEIIGLIESDDFDAWKEMMNNKGIDESLITEDNFAKMKESHDLMQNGDKDAAMEIKNELGELGFGSKYKKGGKFDPEKREAVINALDNNDYNAWKEAVGQERASEVTEDEFPRLIESHNLMNEGKEKFEQAKEIREDIGLKSGPKGMMKHWKK